jgi:hypothetical protein
MIIITVCESDDYQNQCNCEQEFHFRLVSGIEVNFKLKEEFYLLCSL